MRGRRPKPTALKLIDGNRGRRPINKHEPRAVGDLHEAPEWLTDTQQAIWTYAIANAPAGLLKRLDRDTLVTWVVACDLHRRACAQQARLDAASSLPLLTKTREGAIVQSPYVPIINRQALIMMKAASELGFTPSSRSRIEVNPDDDGEGQADDYF